MSARRIRFEASASIDYYPGAYKMSDFRDKYWFKDIRDITTIKDLLYGSVETYPERPAFWVKKKKGAPYEPVSYTLLKHDVQALGTQIRAMGLAGERIGVMGQGCYEWIATYLAVVIGGGVIVPIDKELDSEAIQNVISTAECRTVFYTSDEASKFESVSGVEKSCNNAVLRRPHGHVAEPWSNTFLQ